MYSTAAPVFVRLKGGACNLFSRLTGERPSTLPYFDFPQVHMKPIKDKSTIFPNAVRIASQASLEASISGLNIKTHINPILTCTNGRRMLLKQQFCSSSCDKFLSEEPQTEKPPLIKRKKNKLLSHTRRKLIYGYHRAKGRNARGVMTAWWHRGGGHKRLYRKIDFRRNKTDVCGRIKTIEYDPNRSANICLVQYKDGEKGYIIHPRGARVGDTIVSAGNAIPS